MCSSVHLIAKKDALKFADWSKEYKIGKQWVAQPQKNPTVTAVTPYQNVSIKLYIKTIPYRYTLCITVYSKRFYMKLAEVYSICCFCATVAVACERTLLVVISVTIGLRTAILEGPCIGEIPTRLRNLVVTSAAVPIGVERQTRALAGNDLTTSSEDFHLCSRTTRIDIWVATSPLAIVRTAAGSISSIFWCHRHLNVVSVNQTDVVEVLTTSTVKRNLGQCHRRNPSRTIAFESATTAVACLAAARPTPSPSPDTPGPVIRKCYSMRLITAESDTSCKFIQKFNSFISVNHNVIQLYRCV